jgi:hypothetical protein
MGQAKREMERLDGLRSDAERLLLKTGAISKCEFHDDVLLDQMDDDAKKHAYALGANEVKAGKIDGTHKELMDAIDSVASDAGTECYSCEKWKED